jgi:hypothetical protein
LPRSGEEIPLAQTTKKKDRSNLIVGSGVLSCLSFAYGFSNQSTLFQWVIPVAIPLLAAAWSFRPRAAESRETREGT